MIIRPIDNKDIIPYDLLLLADPSKEAIDDYIQRGNTYIAIDEETIVGTYVILKTRPHTMELVNIAVAESHQGRGIGKHLVQDSIKKAKALGTHTLEVGTGNSSLSQLALYQKCGFRIIGVDKDFFKIHYKDKIIENGIDCVDMIRLQINFNN